MIVDDNEADVHWMQITLGELGLECLVTVLTDGEKAVNFLLKRGTDLGVPEPDIIFLDINLPRFTGLEVLDALQGAVEYSICVVTGSKMERQVVRERFHLDDSCYIVKPVDHLRILEAFHCFEHLKHLAPEITRSASQSKH